MLASISSDNECYALPKREVPLVVRPTLHFPTADEDHRDQRAALAFHRTSLSSRRILIAIRNTLLPRPAPVTIPKRRFIAQGCAADDETPYVYVIPPGEIY